ncbi:hypothetical protein Pelo_4505 [Pelomyxa schiedti]|nr:hypothetical protein Pelo_4505 [Pelomyxa schiedti]
MAASAATRRAPVGPNQWFYIAQSGDVDKLRGMLSADPGLLNSVDLWNHATALHTATASGRTQCVEFLLSMNINVNAKNVCKNLPVSF